MKLILWIMLGLLLFQANHAHAGKTLAKVSGQKVEIVPYKWTNGQTKALAFETYAGDLIAVKHIKNVRTSAAVAIQSVVVDGLIELRSGDIFYSEELKYVATPKGEFTGASGTARALKFDPSVGRAPHTPK